MRAPLLAAIALVALAPVAPAAAQTRTIEPERVLVVDTTKGIIVVEMRPDIAPLAVERITRLAREGVYDGLLFHRVVEHFVVQTGNPNNRDGGGTAYPDLAPEFLFRLKPETADAIATRASDTISGLLGSLPFQSGAPTEAARRPDGQLRAWGSYCTGVAGMGRQAARDSANSEIFFMLEPDHRLDRDYTAWGRIVSGLEVLKSLAVGTPPPDPDVMRRVRVLADLSPNERFEVHLPTTADITRQIDQARRERGADFSICDVEVRATIVRNR